MGFDSKKFRICQFWAVWQKWAILRPHFWIKAAIFFRQSMGTQNGNFTKDYLIFHLTRTKNQLKISFNFGCQSCFCKPIFSSKKLIFDFLAGNNYADLPHLQGVWNLLYKFHLYLIIREIKQGKTKLEKKEKTKENMALTKE